MKSFFLTTIFLFSLSFSACAQFVLCAGDSLELNARSYNGQNIQWQRSVDGGTTYNDIPGGTTARLIVYPDNGDFFRLKVVLDECDTIRFSNAREVVYPCRGDSQITYNGNTYNLIEAGCQCWIGENLQTTNYNDGQPIDFVPGNGDWSSSTSGAFVQFDLQEANVQDYGLLYNWNAVNTGRLCPQDWRVPSNGDWQTLSDFLGANQNAGGKLKEQGTLYWNAPNAGATNEIGFTARPGGMRNFNGGFFFEGTSGYWWTTNSASASGAVYRSISSFSRSLDSQTGSKENGFSVRCVRD